MRLSTRIIALCAAAVLPALAIQTWHEWSLRQARRAGVEQEARRFALQSASELGRLLEGARSMLAAVGEAHLRAGTFPGCSDGLAALRARMERYGSIGIADSEGRILCDSNGPGAARSIAQRGYFRAAIDTGQFQVGQLVPDGPRGPFLPVALPIREDGGPTLVVIAAFDSVWLSANLVTEGALPPEGSVTVADREGVIVARHPQPERFIGQRIPDAFRHLVDAPAPGVLPVTSQDGTRRLLAYLPAETPPVQGLYVSAGYGTAAAFSEIDRATRGGVLMILAGLLSALCAAWVFGRLALRDPVDRLLDAMRRWTAGDRGARAEATGGWEVGRLAVGFNAMADAVALREERLRQEEARLRAVLDQMPVAVVLAEIPSGRETYRNARAEALLPPPGADADPLAEPLRRAVAEGAATEGLELPVIRPDGSETFLSVSAAPVDAAGGRKLAVAAFLDIGARRHAERQQALLTAELRHRVKNALAVVQAVAAQTLAQSPSLEAFKRDFSGRLAHLARAQDALFASIDGTVDLATLVAATMAPFGEIVSWQGPPLALPAKQTLSMALVLHELATNAAKHGALRPGAEGHVAIGWSLEPAGEIAVNWQETTSHPAAPSDRRGFGGRLIERCVAHDLRGKAEQEWRPEGLRWRLRFPRPGPPAAIDAAPVPSMG
jgi:two-component sensor histidine kinase